MSPGHLGLLLTAVLGVVPAQAAPAIVVRTTEGVISGTTTEDGAVRIFKGIPYARPPVGQLRWRAPEPPGSWADTRTATEYGPNCYQSAPRTGDSVATVLFFTPAAPMSEDCLYLNIWSPGAPDPHLSPVMVWIPGGGFHGGSAAGPLYVGEQLARQGIVLVSLNYRVSRLGFLSSPELSAEAPYHSSGNYGLLDQVAALRWIQHNIRRFGGDPGKVTLFGQSAGAYSVNYLLASTLARGLFARAIGESGGAFAPAVQGSLLGKTLQPLAQAQNSGTRLAQALGVSTLTQLRATSAANIMAVPQADRYEGQWPILDGYVLEKSVAEVFAAGHQIDVPTLSGSTADEGTIFPSVHTLPDFLSFARVHFGPRAGEFLTLYPAHDGESARNAAETAFRDYLAGWEDWSWANAQSKTGRAPVYYYYFTRVPPAPGAEDFVENRGSRLGAFHGAELPYVFGTLYPTTWAWTPQDQDFSRLLRRYWVNFARSGNPNGPGLPAWPAFSTRAPRAMTFGETAAAAAAPNQPLYRFWDVYSNSWNGSNTP